MHTYIMCIIHMDNLEAFKRDNLKTITLYWKIGHYEPFARTGHCVEINVLLSCVLFCAAISPHSDPLGYHTHQTTQLVISLFLSGTNSHWFGADVLTTQKTEQRNWRACLRSSGITLYLLMLKVNATSSFVFLRPQLPRLLKTSLNEGARKNATPGWSDG